MTKLGPKLRGLCRNSLAPLIMLAALASALTVTSSYAKGTKSAKAKPFTYLAVIDTSGPTMAYGHADEAALKAGATYFNSHGGIDGHPLRIRVLNDNGDPTTAVTVLDQYLASNTKPNAILGGTSGEDSGGLIEIATRDHILNLGIDDNGGECAKNAQKTCPTTFVPGPQGSQNAIQAAEWFKQRGYNKVGILEEEEAYSESETAPLEAKLTAEGVQYVSASFAPTAVDVTPEISQLKSAGANVIFVETLGSAPGLVATGRANLGLTNSLPLVFDVGSASEDLTTLAPAADLKNSFEQIAREEDPALKFPGRALLIKDAKPFGGITLPIVVPANAWTDVVTLAGAAQQAGSIAEPALLKALTHLSPKAQKNPLNLASRQVKYTQSNHEDVTATSDVFTIVRTGGLKNGVLTGSVG